MPTAVGADAPGSLRAQAETLRERNATLATRRHDALLELYGLESSLARARARVEALRSRRAEVTAERASARARIAIARTTAARAQRELARQVRTLYEQGEPDLVAIVLSSGSLDEALTGLDGLHRAARQTEHVVAQAQQARRDTTRLARTLARRERDLARLEAAARESAAALGQALTERRSYLDSLSAQARLNAREISALETRAVVARRRSERLTTSQPTPAPAAAAPLPGSASSPPPAPVLASETTVPGARTLTVEATGYSLPGTTASGLPVGWGIVAVDPSVIPLGTRMTIPGYGDGVAADTGSAVRGLVIDLWFPTTGQALQWGRRSVTITLR